MPAAKNQNPPLSLSIANATKAFRLCSSSHPSITPSASHAPPCDGEEETIISMAVSILREQLSKSRWSFLKSLYHPVGFSAAQAAEILRHLRNRPHLTLRCHDLHSLAAAAQVLARGRLRSTAFSLLQSAIRSHDPSSSSSSVACGTSIARMRRGAKREGLSGIFSADHRWHLAKFHVSPFLYLFISTAYSNSLSLPAYPVIKGSRTQRGAIGFGRQVNQRKTSRKQEDLHDSHPAISMATWISNLGFVVLRPG